MTLNNAELSVEYIIKDVLTDDEEMKTFLFTLGCYSGEPITVISRKKDNVVLSIKEARYSVDSRLADMIHV